MCFFKSFSWLSFIFITKEFQGSLYFFLILFNFQDAVSVALASSFNIISHSKLFVKYFFQVFFKSFFCVALSCETALILYHFLFFLSSTFFKFFFKKFFCDQLRSLSRQLDNYITFSSLCQVLFEKFFQLVSVFLPEWTSLTSSLLTDSLQSKSNIFFTLSRGSPRSTVMLLYTFFLTLSSKDVFLY